MQSRISKNLESVKSETLYVGIDLGLDRNKALVMDSRARQLDRFGFPHSRDGYDYLLHRLKAIQDKHQGPAVLVGMEPTNYFWKLLANFLEQQNMNYRLVNAYTVKKHREGDQLDRSKDDARDAFMIADLLRTGKYTKTQLLHGGYAELRTYSTLYEQVQRDIRRHKTILRTVVMQLFPELCLEFKDLTGCTAMAMQRGHVSAIAVSELSQEAFIARVRAHFAGKRLMVSKLRRAHVLAANSIGVQDSLGALQETVRMQIDALELLRRQFDSVRTALVDTLMTLPEAPYLLSVHGLGEVMAAVILGEIGDPSRYQNAAQLIKLAGTQPTPNSSGRKNKGSTPISRKGRPRLRTALYFTVLCLVRVDDAFAREHLRLQTRRKNPLTKMQSIGALMNRLLRILWSLMRNRTLYQPDFRRAD